MSINIAISGFGRIGRLALRAVYETNRQEDIKVVAINCSRGDVKSNAHLLKYDTAHGRFNEKVEIDEDAFIINGERIQYLNTRNPEELDWKEYNVDVVLECTGAFRSKKTCQVHLDNGAKKVLISAPGEKDVDATIVYGVNHQNLKSSHQVISNASCTTNGLAPVLKVIHDHLRVESGLMTTIHSYTNDQALLDNMHSDIRRARSAAASMIPTKTGAASAIGLVIPELKGKLDGIAIRVPTTNVSIVDLSLNIQKKVTKNELNKLMKDASENELKDILVYN
ncbi:type I glyceraldehyde-3-phosphate dehydrogenase, partial [Methylophilaceae bacterium]|nr:type I glyceraldehyde-3-phosphate dehydrogenase [Methylophilaceae bacterium]